MRSTSIISFFALAAGVVLANPMPKRGGSSSFNSFITGEGNDVFGNQGVACSVDGSTGVCQSNGQCANEIPPNEIDVLGSGEPVAACTAGGPVGVLDANGDVVPA